MGIRAFDLYATISDLSLDGLLRPGWPGGPRAWLPCPVLAGEDDVRATQEDGQAHGPTCPSLD